MLLPEQEEKLYRTAAEMMSCAFGKEHTFLENGKTVIVSRDLKLKSSLLCHNAVCNEMLLQSIAPLPRFKPNILLVDTEKRNYDKQPNNTLLIQAFADDDDDGTALMDVIAFMHRMLCFRC